MTNNNLQDERERFEAWACSHGYRRILDRYAADQNYYAVVETQTAWEAWQAALASAEQAKPVGMVRHYHYSGIAKNGLFQEAVLNEGINLLPDGTKLYTRPAPSAVVETLKKARHRVVMELEGLASEGAMRQVYQTFDNIISIIPPEAEQPRCEKCNGTGQLIYGYSGHESDGNAPEYGECPDCDVADNARAEAEQPAFQNRVAPWMQQCFGPEISADTVERNHRFLEEALELVQACGCSQHEAHQLVEYVYGRPVGERSQEVGGVMVTLAALCLAQNLDMHIAGDTELTRIMQPGIIEKIRAKQAAKPKHSPLPEQPAAKNEARALDEQAKDAERYRWLREQPASLEPGRIDVVQWAPADDASNDGHEIRLENLDAAIDAAMSQEKAEHDQQ